MVLGSVQEVFKAIWAIPPCMASRKETTSTSEARSPSSDPVAKILRTCSRDAQLHLKELHGQMLILVRPFCTDWLSLSLYFLSPSLSLLQHGQSALSLSLCLFSQTRKASPQVRLVVSSPFSCSTSDLQISPNFLFLSWWLSGPPQLCVTKVFGMCCRHPRSAGWWCSLCRGVFGGPLV